MGKTTYEVHVLDGICRDIFTYEDFNSVRVMKMCANKFGWQVFVYPNTHYAG